MITTIIGVLVFVIILFTFLLLYAIGANKSKKKNGNNGNQNPQNASSNGSRQSAWQTIKSKDWVSRWWKPVLLFGFLHVIIRNLTNTFINPEFYGKYILTVWVTFLTIVIAIALYLREKPKNAKPPEHKLAWWVIFLAVIALITALLPENKVRNIKDGKFENPIGGNSKKPQYSKEILSEIPFGTEWSKPFLVPEDIRFVKHRRIIRYEKEEEGTLFLKVGYADSSRDPNKPEVIYKYEHNPKDNLALEKPGLSVKWISFKAVSPDKNKAFITFLIN